MTSPIAHFSRVRFSWIDGSNLSCLVPFDVFKVMITLVTILFPVERSSLSSVLSSAISPSHPYFVSLIFKPMDRLKFSIRTSVFLTYEENTSEPTMGQKGTFGPSSWAIANAIAVFPVPGGPANNNALPAIFLALIKSTATPAACINRFVPIWQWSGRPYLGKFN